MNWMHDLAIVAQREEPFVMVTVIEISGSAPREIGARMLVTDSESLGSIGGGNLEFTAIKRAREYLGNPDSQERRSEFFGLGVTMNQCCGGAVQLLYEKFSTADATAVANELEACGKRRIAFFVSPVNGDGMSRVLSNRSDRNEIPPLVSSTADSLLLAAQPNSKLVGNDSQKWFVTRIDEQPTRIVLFGAGHVGKALIRLLQDLPFHIDWVDERADIFPSQIPENVVTIQLKEPTEILENKNSGTFYVVMTHSHGRDYEICLKILQIRKFGWLGMIGSEIKRKRFEKRFVDDGIDPFTLSRFHCPIGVNSIKGKFPAVIAMSTAAQLLEARQCALDSDSPIQMTGSESLGLSAS